MQGAIFIASGNARRSSILWLARHRSVRGRKAGRDGAASVIQAPYAISLNIKIGMAPPCILSGADQASETDSVWLLNALILVISAHHHASKDGLAFPLTHATSEKEGQGREEVGPTPHAEDDPGTRPGVVV